MDNTILKKLRCYWVPLLWVLCIIVASVATFNAGGVFIIIAGVVNLVAGIWVVICRAKAWAKDIEKPKE